MDMDTDMGTGHRLEHRARTCTRTWTQTWTRTQKWTWTWTCTQTLRRTWKQNKNMNTEHSNIRSPMVVFSLKNFAYSDSYRNIIGGLMSSFRHSKSDTIGILNMGTSIRSAHLCLLLYLRGRYFFLKDGSYQLSINYLEHVYSTEVKPGKTISPCEHKNTGKPENVVEYREYVVYTTCSSLPCTPV
jgi:hypothetical protein